jgi:flagellin-like protein
MRARTVGDETRAVSPVIGAILMIAITVVMATVGGVFALGLADATSPTAPQVTWNLYHDDDGAASANAEVVITHESGATIDADRLTVYVDDTPVAGASGYAFDGGGWTGEVTAGASVTIVKQPGPDTDWTGETVRVVWRHEREDVSATLVRYTPG